VPTSSFVVDRESGHVWLRGNPFAVTSRSRRSPADDVVRLGITVLAEDGGGRSAQARVEVTVRPEGSVSKKTLEHQLPKFTEKIFVFEVRASAPVGHVIGRLVVVFVVRIFQVCFYSSCRAGAQNASSLLTVLSALLPPATP